MQQTTTNTHAPRVSGRNPLSRQQFEQSLKQALKDYARPDRLHSNALLGCSFVRDACRPQVDTALKAARLRELIARHSNLLAEAKKTQPYQKVLDATYLRPAVNQAAAARELGMPFSSYRRYLADAVRLLTAHLWVAELQQREQNLVQKVNTVRD